MEKPYDHVKVVKSSSSYGNWLVKTSGVFAMTLSNRLDKYQQDQASLLVLYWDGSITFDEYLAHMEELIKSIEEGGK